MGCPTVTEIGDSSTLTFSITTHDPDTGIITDADESPVYRIYEDEISTAIAYGDMVTLDDMNTTGFYAKTIVISEANGYEHEKTYTIYITAVVDGNTGGITYGFKAVDPLILMRRVNTEVVDAIFHDVYDEPFQQAPLASTSLVEKINYLYKSWRNKKTQTATTWSLFNDDGIMIGQKATVTDDGTTTTKEEIISGS